jgi:hypothetical protein
VSVLAGYPGGSDKVGNWVNKQFQLDALGEALLLFAAAARHDHLDTWQWQAAETAVAAIKARRDDADAGVWELDDRRWAHSRLMCVAGLRAIAGAAASKQAGEWEALADSIMSGVSGDCLHPDGRWQRAPDDAERTRRCCCLPSAVPPRPTIPARGPPCRRFRTTSPGTATSTGSGTMSGHSARLVRAPAADAAGRCPGGAVERCHEPRARRVADAGGDRELAVPH